MIEAEQALASFAQSWDAKYPTIAKMWRANWTMPIHHWKQALNHIAILFEDRMPQPINH